jgi:hypothetical protein
VLDETMDYTSLEDAYGSPFGQRAPITHIRKDVKEQPIAKPEFTSLTTRAEESVRKNQSLIDQVAKTINYDTEPTTENFRVEEKFVPRVNLREKFSQSQPASVFHQDTQQAEKLSRILRLVEQNRTGYERPAIQDMVLYIATGVFFLFTFDTFVLLGKSMSRRN